jgi:hypothetical protein
VRNSRSPAGLLVGEARNVVLRVPAIGPPTAVALLEGTPTGTLNTDEVMLPKVSE